MLIIGIILFLFGFGILALFIFKISAQLNSQLNNLTQELNARLKEHSQALQDTHKTVGDRLDNATKVFGMVQQSLGKVDAVNQQILEVGKDISSLQQLLQPPKMRGGIGETLLNNILSQIFGEHKEFYQLQYQFKNGQVVDAVIRLGQNLITIDAKFPLESFNRLLSSSTEEEKKNARRDFTISVKKKIDDISSKYILPDENTFDFSLMYIPVEAIYYEIIKDDQFWSYASGKKVIPVSPNSFYPYLKIISQGLVGMKLSRDIQEVITGLKRLDADLGRFKDDFRILGDHIKNSRIKYEDAEKKLDRFTDKLSSTQQIKTIEAKEAK